jgi:hypothetical protein
VAEPDTLRPACRSWCDREARAKPRFDGTGRFSSGRGIKAARGQALPSSKLGGTQQLQEAAAGKGGFSRGGPILRYCHRRTNGPDWISIIRRGTPAGTTRTRGATGAKRLGDFAAMAENSIRPVALGPEELDPHRQSAVRRRASGRYVSPSSLVCRESIDPGQTKLLAGFSDAYYRSPML